MTLLIQRGLTYAFMLMALVPIINLVPDVGFSYEITQLSLAGILLVWFAGERSGPDDSSSDSRKEQEHA